MQDEEKEIDISDYIILLASKYKAILGVMVLSAAIAVFLLCTKPAQYKVGTVVENADIEGPVVGANQVGIIINSVDVLMKVKDSYNAKYGTEMKFRDIASKTKVSVIDDMHFMIETTAGDAKVARILNDMTVAEYFNYMKSTYKLKKRLLQERFDVSEEEVELSEKNILELKKEILNFVKEKKVTPEPVYKSILLRNVYAQHVQNYYGLVKDRTALKTSLLEMKNFRVLVPSEVPPVPDKNKKMLFVLAYFFYGLPVGIILVFIIEYAKNIRKLVIDKRGSR